MFDLRVIAQLCIFLLLGLCCGSARAQGAGDREYALGVAEFKKANYAQAISYFKSAVATASPSNHCIRKLYLGHSYAGNKELGMAVKTYRDIEATCHGSPEAKLATKCIEELMHPSTVRTVAAARKSSGDSLINRIKVIEVRHSDEPIDPNFIGMVKTTVSSLRSDLYQMLDKGGCSIYIAQNIIDKWPFARNLSRPGYERLKLSQDFGLTQGVDIYIWERQIFPGHILGPPFPQEYSQGYLRMQLGRVACHTQGIDNDKEYLDCYKKDYDKIAPDEKSSRGMQYLLEKDGPAQLAA